MPKQIPLTQGQFAIVDGKNHKYLLQWKWFATWNIYTQSFYAVRKSEKRNDKRYIISMAREILGLKRGNKKQPDHINHKTLDNRESNLRTVTRQQNQFNRKNTKGYSWDKYRRKYKSRIRLNGRGMHIGYFDTSKEAHNAYLKAKKLYHKI